MTQRLRAYVIVLVLLSPAIGVAGSVDARVVYGEDDRLDVYQVQDPALLQWAQSTAALVSASRVRARADGQFDLITRPYGPTMNLCPSERFYDQDAAAFCSGFLIAPDLLVTAGHCVESKSDCKSTRFIFGFHSPLAGEIRKTFAARDVVACGDLLHTEAFANGSDFAIVRLERPVEHLPPLALRSGAAPLSGTPLTVIGHPSGLPTKIAGGASVRSLANGYFIANLDTYGGNSGSAVLNDLTGEVEGVLVRGETDFVHQNGCRVSKVCSDSDCRGEDVTDTRRILDRLAAPFVASGARRLLELNLRQRQKEATGK
jgi:hypothetical protein